MVNFELRIVANHSVEKIDTTPPPPPLSQPGHDGQYWARLSESAGVKHRMSPSNGLVRNTSFVIGIISVLNRCSLRCIIVSFSSDKFGKR